MKTFPAGKDTGTVATERVTPRRVANRPTVTASGACPRTLVAGALHVAGHRIAGRQGQARPSTARPRPGRTGAVAQVEVVTHTILLETEATAGGVTAAVRGHARVGRREEREGETAVQYLGGRKETLEEGEGKT